MVNELFFFKGNKVNLLFQKIIKDQHAPKQL